MINGERLPKPSQLIIPGQILVFFRERENLTIKIMSLASRRGPSSEAQKLYENLTPRPEKPNSLKVAKSKSPFKRDRGKGRPTKAERRALDKLKNFE